MDSREEQDQKKNIFNTPGNCWVSFYCCYFRSTLNQRRKTNPTHNSDLYINLYNIAKIILKTDQQECVPISVGAPFTWSYVNYVLWSKQQAENIHVSKNEINNSLKNANL